jgi:hypothetical protein
LVDFAGSRFGASERCAMQRFKLLLTICLLQVVDVTVTVIGLMRHMVIREANPLINTLIDEFGITGGMVIAMSLKLALASLLVVWVRPRIAWLVIAVHGVVILWNVSVLIVSCVITNDLHFIH